MLIGPFASIILKFGEETNQAWPNYFKTGVEGKELRPNPLTVRHLPEKDFMDLQ